MSLSEPSLKCGGESLRAGLGVVCRPFFVFVLPGGGGCGGLVDQSLSRFADYMGKWRGRQDSRLGWVLFWQEDDQRLAV